MPTARSIPISRVRSNTVSTSGVVLLSEYHFTGTAFQVVYEDHQLYQWDATDPAYNPIVATDTKNTPAIQRS